MENTQNNDVGAIGGLLLDKNKEPIHSSGKFPSKTHILLLLLRDYIKRFLPLSSEKEECLSFEGFQYFSVDYITGADLFMPAELIRKYNGFDSRFFMYYEETDLQKQIHETGLKRCIIEGPLILHLESASSKNWNKKRLLTTSSMFKYMKKHSKISSYYLFRMIYPILRLPALFDKRFTYMERIDYFKFLFFNL
jgi:GT2 family glycosyltransferase